MLGDDNVGLRWVLDLCFCEENFCSLTLFFLVKTKVLQNTTTHTKSEGSGGCSTIWVGMGWSGKQEQRLPTICDILGATPPWVPRSCRQAIGVSDR